MNKLKSSLLNMILSLGTITIVSGAILAEVYSVTKEPIALAEQEKKILAVKDVLPEFNNDPIADSYTIELENGIKYIIYPATDNGTFTGAAIESRTMDGFAGEIVVMFGFNAEGTVTGYTILQHAETPGLGSKMNEWFKDTTGKRSVIGLNPSVSNINVTKDGGEIDGITAATISSRAFLGCLRNAYDVFKVYKPNVEHK